MNASVECLNGARRTRMALAEMRAHEGESLESHWAGRRSRMLMCMTLAGVLASFCPGLGARTSVVVFEAPDSMARVNWYRVAP